MKKFFLLTIAALLLVGLSVNDCIGQSKKKLQGQITKTDKTVTELGTKVEKIGDSLTDLNVKVAEVNTSVAGLNTKVTKTNAGVADLSESVKSVAEVVHSANDKVEQMQIALSKFMEQQKGASSSIPIYEASETLPVADTSAGIVVATSVKDSVSVKVKGYVSYPMKGEILYSENETIDACNGEKKVEHIATYRESDAEKFEPKIPKGWTKRTVPR